MITGGNELTVQSFCVKHKHQFGGVSITKKYKQKLRHFTYDSV